jgi:hypothetical protein
MKLKDILKAANNKYATVASDGLEGSDVKGFISTGSYAFNALLSGSIHGGMPDNKIFALAGEQATGKTYFALNVVREFLNPDASRSGLDRCLRRHSVGNLGQQVALAGDEGLAQTKAAAVQEAAILPSGI